MIMTSAPRLKPRFRLRKVVQSLHLWSSLVVGLFLVLATSTGVITMFKNDLNRVFYAPLFRITPTDQPIGLHQAQQAVQRAYPEHTVVEVIEKPGEPHYVGMLAPDETYFRAYVDPGTGKVNGAYAPDQTALGVVSSLHETLLAEGLAFPYAENTPEWIKAVLGEHLGELILKLVSLAFLGMVLTGAYLWWPSIKKFALGFALRLNKSAYLRHHDWHKLLGIISLPMLLIWAITSLNFFTPFKEPIKSLWHTMTLTQATNPEPELSSKPRAGQAILDADAAKRLATASVPGSIFTTYILPEGKDGVIYVYLAKGLDPYAHAPAPGNGYVAMDAYSGQVLHDSFATSSGFAADAYDHWFFGLHTGTFLPWGARLLWALFGLVPTILAFTGISMWWLKRSKRMRDPNKPAPIRSHP
jgi:uncharacterized iron-regulated membrane protein